MFYKGKHNVLCMILEDRFLQTKVIYNVIPCNSIIAFHRVVQ